MQDRIQFFFLFVVVNIACSISFLNESFAIEKKQNSSTIVQPVSLAVSFETLSKEQKVLHTISFDGQQKTLISGNVNSATDFTCDTTGKFEIVSVGLDKFVAALLEFNCSSNTGQSNQKVKSKVGRFLFPVKDYQSFFKIIFLHKDQPEVVLKIKDLSL